MDKLQILMALDHLAQNFNISNSMYSFNLRNSIHNYFCTKTIYTEAGKNIRHYRGGLLFFLLKDRQACDLLFHSFRSSSYLVFSLIINLILTGLWSEWIWAPGCFFAFFGLMAFLKR